MTSLPPPIIQQFHSSLKNTLPCYLSYDKHQNPRIRTMGLLPCLWHWRDTKFHNERYSKLAAVITRILETQPRLTIAAATENPIIRTGKDLLKSAQRYHANSPEIDALKKQLTAAKFGIAPSVLDRNPGFQAFADKYVLERYLMQYDDVLIVNPASQEISIKKNDLPTPWSEISKEIQSWPKQIPQPYQPWVYGSKGIQNKNMYDWTELTPYKKEDPAQWNHQYVFEFCVCHNPETVKNGSHSWIRLKTPTGDIYSVGLYRPGKADWTDTYKAPMRIKPAQLMQPDVSEFWPFKIYTIDVAITEDNFLKMKQAIEQDKKNEDLLFQLFNNNCLLYCKKIGAIGGFYLPTEESVLHVITPISIAKPITQIFEFLPACFTKVCKAVAAFFMNLTQLFLGASLVDPNLNENQKKRAIPHLTSIKDVFNPNKMNLNHPNTMAFKTRPQVISWRKQEINKLIATETDHQKLIENYKKILLDLPDSFKKPTCPHQV